MYTYRMINDAYHNHTVSGRSSLVQIPASRLLSSGRESAQLGLITLDAEQKLLSVVNRTVLYIDKDLEVTPYSECLFCESNKGRNREVLMPSIRRRDVQ